MSVQEDRIDRLYRLLPAVHRMRDSDQGEPLRALLQVIAEQVNLVEDDIAQLYENWFIETCEDWVVPYIADLVGHRPVNEAGEPGDVSSTQGRARNRILVPRREVANTLRYRRRKGTLALLELLAADVAGWPTRAVEFYRLLAQTQSLRHPQPGRGRTADLRGSDALDLLNGPFDGIAHTVDVRRILSRHAQGRHNLPGVGVFVWRLRAYSITHAPAYCLEDVGPHVYLFSALGDDTPLYARPRREEDAGAIATEANLPVPIRRRAFAAPAPDVGGQGGASPAYYGLVAPDSHVAQSVALWAEDWPGKGVDNTQPIPATRIIPADLSDWSYVPPRDHVAVDPVLGRFMFPPKQLPKRGVWVSYHYGFSADMGGGEYERPLAEADGVRLIHVTGQEELRVALQTWARQSGADGAVTPHPDQPQHAVIELTDSGVYVVPVNILLAAGHTLQIRAAQRTRPLLRLLDWQSDRPDNLSVEGGEGSRFTLDGVVVAGRGVQIEGGLASFVIRHATLVPGWSLQENCEPRRPAEPSIELINSNACIVIEHSIVGSIQVNNDEVMTDPVRIRVSDSILDATGADCEGTECEAIGAAGLARAHATLRIVRSTVIGRVMVHAIELAENSIFIGGVTVARRQIGCMRFCYVPPCSRTPKRFNCQPDGVQRAAAEQVREDTRAGGLPPPSDADIAAAQQREAVRVRPRFNSLRYGTPVYCQLACDCAEEITRGADDESEMGAFHDLFQPQRLANLRARIDEYTPAGMEAGIVIVS
jgi:hypothetical protein